VLADPILPVFAIMALGYAMGLLGVTSQEDARRINRFAMRIASRWERRVPDAERARRACRAGRRSGSPGQAASAMCRAGASSASVRRMPTGDRGVQSD
ncbi:MAG: hypothetical protein AAFV96_17060, partial [Pseudomonadota bacterium]